MITDVGVVILPPVPMHDIVLGMRATLPLICPRVVCICPKIVVISQVVVVISAIELKPS